MGALSNPALAIVAGWTLTKTVTGTNALTQSDRKRFAQAFNTTVTNTAYVNPAFAIAAGANTDINLNSFADQATNNTTMTKGTTLFVMATGANGAQVKISPGLTNPLRWFFGSNTDSLTYKVGTRLQCAFACGDGSDVTISNTSCNLNFSNPGNTTVTVTLVVHGGT